MIRLFLCLIAFLLLPLSLSAQEVDCPDVDQLRNGPEFDLSVTYPEGLLLAVVLSEDRNFYSSFTTGAVTQSTITGQLARIFIAPTPQTMQSKMVEFCLVDKFSAAFSSDEILKMWLQSRFFGQGCFGPEDSMQTLIGRPLDEGDMADFITLAALIKSPVRSFQDADHLSDRFNAIIENANVVGAFDEATQTRLLAQGARPLSRDFCPYAP